MRIPKRFTFSSILRRITRYISLFLCLNAHWLSQCQWPTLSYSARRFAIRRELGGRLERLTFFVGNNNSVIREHFISQLMQEAEEKYRKKLRGQSKTLKAAIIEYNLKRRYRRPPPKRLWSSLGGAFVSGCPFRRSAFSDVQVIYDSFSNSLSNFIKVDPVRIPFIQ